MTYLDKLDIEFKHFIGKNSPKKRSLWLYYMIFRPCLVKSSPRLPPLSISLFTLLACFSAQLLGLYEECLNPAPPPPPPHLLLPICLRKRPCWLFVAVVCEICVKAEQLETKLVHFKRRSFLPSQTQWRLESEPWGVL